MKHDTSLCMSDCTDDFEKPKMFSIKRNQVEDPLETVEINYHRYRKKQL